MNKQSIRKRIPPHIEEHFLAQKKSGLTIKDYCTEHSLSCGTFYGWRTAYINKQPRPSTEPLFKEIQILPHQGAVCEVQFPGGISVTVFGGSGESDLLPVFKLAQSLESC